MSAPVVCVLRERGPALATVQHQGAEAAELAGFDLLYADAVVQPGEPFTDSIHRAIASSDVVVAVLGDRQSASLWLEVGMALALRKPTVTISSSPDVDMPVEAQWTTLKVGPIVTVPAIVRALQRASKGSAYARSGSRRQQSYTGAPLRDATEELLDALNAVTETRDERAFEQWFAQVLDRAKVPYDRSRILKSEQRAFEIDFVVTADEFKGNLGNPLPIELKLSGSMQRGIFSRLDTLGAYLRATGAQTLLFLTGSTEENAVLLGVNGGVVLTCDARTLVRAMSSNTFGRAVIDIRNKVAHGVPL